MKCNKLGSVLLGAGLMLSMSIALAKDEKAEKKAEAAMMTACKKEYAKEVKAKSFKEVADWVETEEKGTNAETFKKSKCYTLHEKWEDLAEKHEEGETHENK